MEIEPQPKPTLDFKLEFLFSRRSLVRREVVGVVGQGFRVNLFVEGGTVNGPALCGTCGAGSDWFTLRRDGVGIIDSRVTIRASSGAIISCTYSGVADFGETAFDRLQSGEMPTSGPIHIAARFETAAPEFMWLNRILAIGIGRNDPEGNLWDTYAIR